ncbi:MAG: Small nuclear ribonucleoprotein-associated protein B [Ramalina farinacea]|uniref:Sm protein B n=1 Tax=Ramalina farinacea TaxID=258253 RepID=A0AA43QTY7_9LECA|nr:Small nuclear ribonucleoprotein-associated protein B [Ramalina farinacea]
MNLVLADTEEFRRVKRKPTKASQPAPGSASTTLIESEEKRTLGLTIIRGTHIVSCSVDGPPPADPSARLGTSAPGGLLVEGWELGWEGQRPVLAVRRPLDSLDLGGGFLEGHPRDSQAEGDHPVDHLAFLGPVASKVDRPKAFNHLLDFSHPEVEVFSRHQALAVVGNVQWQGQSA